MNKQQEKHQITSTIKISVNVALSLLVVVILILYQWFVIEDAITQFQTGISYWISKVIMGIAMFMLMISLCNIVEEWKRKKDKDFIGKLDALDSHYLQVHENGEIENLETYVLNVNKQAKFDVYVAKIKKKIHRINKKVKDKDKREALLVPLEQALLKSVEEVWEEEYIKFNEITTTLLFSGAVDVPNASNVANDLHDHRAKYSLQKLLWKFMFIFAFGIMSGEIAYSFNDFSKDDIIPLILKIFSILWTMYSGICFGIFMHDQICIVLRKKLRILSQFRSRQDGNKDFSVAPSIDLLIDKTRLKYGLEVVSAKSTQVENKNEQDIEKPKESNNNENKSVLKQTWDNTFGSGNLVKPQQFATQLLENMVVAEAKKNVD